MTRILIVRHGNTFSPGEAPRRVGAPTDLPLVASGVAQAHALAAHFAKHVSHIERLFTSPLRRTWETAAILAASMGAPEVRPAEWLREIDHGPDENRTEEEVVRRIGADALHAWDTRAVVPPGWDVGAPARLAAWRDFFARCDTDTVLVTSNGAARFALMARPDLGEQLSGFKLRTGAYGELRLEASGECQIVCWDQRPPA